MAPFRLHHDELRHELPWLLMRNGPVTKYWRREIFEEDVGAMQAHGYIVRRFDCAVWSSESAMHTALKSGLDLPGYTGGNFDALSDSITEIDVPEHSGVLVALDNFSEAHRGDVLLEVLTSASRWWLLFGRVFCTILRTDNPRYEGRAIGGVSPSWNGREWLNGHRGL